MQLTRWTFLACAVLVVASFVVDDGARLANAQTKPATAETAQETAWRLLLPAPHEVETGDGCVSLGPSIELDVPAKWGGTVGRYLWLLNEVLESRKAVPAKIVEGSSAAAIHVVQKAAGDLPENGYELKVGNGAIELAASDPGGVFNGLATLAQLIELCGSETIEVPCGWIRD